MYNLFYNYIINPIFYFIDYIYESLEDKNNEEEDLSKYYKCYYDINNDKIIIPYTTIEDKKYILKVNRNIDINIKNTIEELKNTFNEEEPYTSIQINGEEKNIRRFFGPNGLHDDIQKIKVSDILFSDEIDTFEKLELMDNFCDYKEINELNEYIL